MLEAAKIAPIDRIAQAQQAAQYCGSTVLLKGARASCRLAQQ